LLQRVYRQWYMLYQSNEQWHGEAVAAALAAALDVAAVAAALAAALDVAAVAAASADSLAKPG
jgi:hypothetical protein